MKNVVLNSSWREYGLRSRCLVARSRDRHRCANTVRNDSLDNADDGCGGNGDISDNPDTLGDDCDANADVDEDDADADTDAGTEKSDDDFAADDDDGGRSSGRCNHVSSPDDSGEKADADVDDCWSLGPWSSNVLLWSADV